VLLRDLVAIPDEVHAGDLVLSLAQGVKEKSTITAVVQVEVERVAALGTCLVDEVQVVPGFPARSRAFGTRPGAPVTSRNSVMGSLAVAWVVGGYGGERTGSRTS